MTTKMKMTTLLSVLMLLSIFSNAQQVDTSFFHGKWRLNATATFDNLLPSALAQVATMDSLQIAMIKEDLSHQQLTFEEDGAYTMSFGDGAVNGKWEFLSLEQMLLLTIGDQTIIHKVNQSNNGALVLQVQDESDETSLFHYWYYNKE